MKRRLQSKISFFLLMLVSMGLAITTLHSHHHLEFNHSKDFADTGHCVSVDTTVCPITGYIFETDVLSASYFGEAFFDVSATIIADHFFIDALSVAVNRGRSPPFQA